LESFCLATGYGRKYATKVLKGRRRLRLQQRHTLALKGEAVSAHPCG